MPMGLSFHSNYLGFLHLVPHSLGFCNLVLLKEKHLPVCKEGQGLISQETLLEVLLIVLKA